MNAKLIGIAIFTLFGCFVKPVFASTYIACDGCNQDQMANAALANGVGRVIVGNIPGNDVAAFRVYGGTHANVMPRGPQANLATKLYVDDGSITQNELTAFSKFVEFYNAFPVGYRKQYNLQIVPAGSPTGPSINVSAISSKIPVNPVVKSSSPGYFSPMGIPVPGNGTVNYPTPGTNVYSVINSGPAQNAFLGWIGNLGMFNISNTLTDFAYMLSVFHVTNINNMPMVSFTVTFTDDSRIGVYVDSSQLPMQILINQKTGVDSHGNNVPASKDAVAGNGRQDYNFLGNGNPADMGQMNSQIGAFGIPVPSTWIYACTNIGGGSINCTYIK